MRRLKKLSKRSRTSGLLAGCLAVVALLATASAASAVTYRPTRTDDPVPNGCQKHNCSLREAVIAANAGGMPATILLRPGKRYELTRPGPGEDAALTGDLDVTAPLLVGTKGLIGTRQRHRGTKLAVIDGNGIDRVFDIHATTLRLVWTVVRGGHARRTAGDDGNGGAIRGGVLKIHSKSRLVDNVADGNGGAFATTLSEPLFNGGMSTVLIKGNHAAGSGGALYVESAPRRFLPMDGSDHAAPMAVAPGARSSAQVSRSATRPSPTTDPARTGAASPSVERDRAASIGRRFPGTSLRSPSGRRLYHRSRRRAGRGDKGLFAAISTIANNARVPTAAGSPRRGAVDPDLESVTLARNGVAAGRLGGGLYLGDGDTVSVRNTILALRPRRRHPL